MRFSGLRACLVLLTLSACMTPPEIPDVGFVSPRLKELRQPAVAVLAFENRSGFLGADYLVADEFNLRLGMTGDYRMVERLRVKELYEEQDLDPRRMDDTTAARAGRMLGAKAVIFGTVTKYRIADRPPDIPADAFPILIPGTGPEAAALNIVANTGAALIAFLSMDVPVAEVGVTVRMVETETGEILWQARNSYIGDAEDLKKRRPRTEWDRLRKDVVFLTSVLASDMIETLKEDQK